MKTLISALALMACISTAQAQDFKWDINIEHYTIRGLDGYALMEQMAKRGPKIGKQKGRSWAASFIKYIGGTYEPCYLQFHVDIIMPRWKDYDKAPPEAKANWDKFYKRVMNHEKEHISHYQRQEAYIKAHKCEDKYIDKAWTEADKLGAMIDARDNYVPKELANISVDAPISLLTN